MIDVAMAVDRWPLAEGTMVAKKKRNGVTRLELLNTG
jgi:hypothetical protein